MVMPQFTQFFCWWTLSCFYLLAMMKSVIMNMCVHVFESLFSIPLDIYLAVELLGLLVILFNLLRNNQVVFHRD